MRIAYISVATPFSRRSWSGIPWYSHREVLRRFPDTHVLETPSLDRVTTKAALLERAGFAVRRRHVVAQHYSKVIDQQLEKLQPDAIVAVAAAHKIAYIDPKWPIVYAADAMYATVIAHYRKYHVLHQRARIQGDALQRALLERVDRALLCSQWAVDAASQTYGLDPAMLRTVPMGANLDIDPGFRQPTIDGPLRLLFVGYDWKRKGGPVLLDVWRELRARTGNAELHIVGARPRAARGLAGVKVHGKIDKSDRAGYEKLIGLYRQSNFMAMPSREEAFGIVYCEAAAFGRPVIAAQTGGVGGVVDDDQTGLLLPLDASPADYADRILRLWGNRDQYLAMCLAARRKYEAQLNWSAWGDAVATALAEVVEPRAEDGASG
ncbi:glycosyltransferase family 4 protein [Sphingomonas turrisvirgatae]|uniref:Glycosyl transferase group 1 n=1 Tax=Sphingomonas turrisvirgatae TaxID=1888892 RepID=A0A1E3LRY5_9SPHN|nr:glycosyltransferase family 4 protein [Sphingomonas turrisvirgatae]ODP36493.1 glycosyl transferase group 1 [Sphingomonas turrisvirgatae]